MTIGYYKDADKNREAFDANGYFRTGDLGFLDESDNLYFRGRLKEMIKTGGINVAPVEVEESLLRHPAREARLRHRRSGCAARRGDRRRDRAPRRHERGRGGA